MRGPVLRGTVAAGVLLALGACSLAPTYQRPAAPVPPAWPSGPAYPALATAPQAAPLPALSYAEMFRDARLQRLIALALEQNRDLRVAAANIAQARAQYRIQQAELLPVVGASVSGSYSDSSAANRPSSGSGGVSIGKRASFAAQGGISAFELDLFGRVRSQTEAELNRYFATEAAARATRLTLIGDIAAAWLTYAADRSLMLIAEDTLDNARRSVELTRYRLNGGVAPRTDLRQAETVLATAEADLAQQKTALAQDVNALQLLVGAPVDPALLPATLEEAAPTLADPPAGLDSAILLRRPDVVQAEYGLRAANAEIGAARAALFPSISLTSLAGVASTALSDLFTGGAFTWQAGGGASYSIFQAGAGRARVQGSRAAQEAAVASYERAIQTAFREVSDALARRGTIDEQLAADSRLTDAAADTFRLTEARYQGGVASFLESLDAQRTLYGARRGLVQTRLIAAANRVTLYRVLGGDALIDAAGKHPVGPTGQALSRP